MLQCVTCLALGVHDDHVGPQLGQTIGQENIRRQTGHQIEAVLQQADAQAAGALGLAHGVVVALVGDIQIGGYDNNTHGIKHVKTCARIGPMGTPVPAQ